MYKTVYVYCTTLLLYNSLRPFSIYAHVASQFILQYLIHLIAINVQLEIRQHGLSVCPK